MFTPTPAPLCRIDGPVLISVEARVNGPLERTLKQKTAGYGPALAAQVVRLLRWRGDFVMDLHAGDLLRILFSDEQGPELQALSYQGEQIQLQAYRYTDSRGLTDFYDAEGLTIAPRLVRAPVPDYEQITETVQSGKGRRKHNGLDVKAPTGTPVILPFAGRVVRVNWHERVNGRSIEVVYAAEGRPSVSAFFLHLHMVQRHVRPGVYLEAGVPLGTVGCTGRCGAPHLHYEIRAPDGTPVDPFNFHGSRQGKVTDAERAAFLALRDRYARQLEGESAEADNQWPPVDTR